MKDIAYTTEQVAAAAVYYLGLCMSAPSAHSLEQSEPLFLQSTFDPSQTDFQISPTLSRVQEALKVNRPRLGESKSARWHIVHGVGKWKRLRPLLPTCVKTPAPHNTAVFTTPPTGNSFKLVVSTQNCMSETDATMK